MSELTTATNTNYHSLNAMLNLFNNEGKFQLEKDVDAVRQYFLQHVNINTVFFHSLKEKLEYLFEYGYYEKGVFDQYSSSFVKKTFQRAYAKKFRFKTFLAALKYYTGYTLKTTDGQRYLERYEDRVSTTALYLARGDEAKATSILDEIMSGRYQPATPTFLNAGKARRGELVSCFLLRIEDSMESIAKAVTSALQLSKRGGGVALLLTNLRETGAPIKGVENTCSGIIPVMKMLEDAFSYANQLGSRSGAGAVYLNAHHPDILKFLDTKRENADEKIRIKTLSTGVVIPNITFELAKNNEPMYLFSPYDIERVYGKAMGDISVTEKYREMVANPKIRKTKINAREFFQTIAELQFQSGYPYIMYEDSVNAQHSDPNYWLNMSNLCTEILEVNAPSKFDPVTGLTSEVGLDISCNLGSMNIAMAMDGKDLGKTVISAMDALTTVSLNSNVAIVDSIKRGNDESHSVGLGQMNLHGYLAREGIYYGSEESIEFVHAYFAAVRYWALFASNKLAKETGQKFVGFEKTTYADGSYLKKYTEQDYNPKTEKVKSLFKGHNLPGIDEWKALIEDIKIHGIYHRYQQAIPPTGSISYINNSTSSIHPIVSKIEIRKEGKIGRVYYPAPFMTNDNAKYYQDAYEIGPLKLIDVYAAANEHVDQGLSMTLFFPDTATTRDVTKAQMYAWQKGIRTIYYVRIRQQVMSGTDVEGCVSCAL